VAVKINIDGREHEVQEGQTILEACRDLGVSIPTLCYHAALSTVGTCRVCVVEVEGARNLQPACVTQVTDGMKIKTKSTRVNNAIRFNLGLLLSNHPNDCMTCDVNGNCEFQDLIYQYDVKDMFPKSLRDVPYDTSSPSLFRDMIKCITCGRCVRACTELQGLSILSEVERGYHVLPLPSLGAPIGATDCINCGQCATVCPVGAITERMDFRKVLHELDIREKVLVVQTAPSVRVALGEEFGEEPGTVTTGKMVAALRRLGFDYVFDVNFTADLTIMEEGSELLERLKTGGKFPMFTSCCPGWINLVEKYYPEFTENLSSAKSPQEMLGPLVKTYFAKKIGKKPEDIFLVSIMPCTAKKDEAERPQQRVDDIQTIDAVLTTRELGKIIKMHKIPYESLEEEDYDEPLGISTGAAAIFGTTGGVMEAALRTAYELHTGEPLPKLDFDDVRGFEGIKETVVDIKGTKLRVAVAHGGANLVKLMEKIKTGEAEYDFVEMMACPGGCIGGGGQPKSNRIGYLQDRMKSIYEIDTDKKLRKSHENPAIIKIYEDYLGKPLSHLSHELLHTTYTSKKASVIEREKELEKVK